MEQTTNIHSQSKNPQKSAGSISHRWRDLNGDLETTTKSGMEELLQRIGSVDLKGTTSLSHCYGQEFWIRGMENARSPDQICLTNSFQFLLAQWGLKVRVENWLNLIGSTGIHIASLQYMALAFGFSLALIEFEPVLEVENKKIHHNYLKVFLSVLKGRMALIIGDTHACAWHDNWCIDPNLKCMNMCEWDNVHDIREAWLLIKH
jgi:hypothetical protein